MIRRWLGVPLLCALAMSAAAAAPAVLTPPEHRRGEEQTFLTFPEWFLVFSPAEYADFVRSHTPDGFVFWGHIHQFWQGYAAVAHESRARHNPVNPGYHLMIMVIGTSTTVEYAARSAYETLVGRVAAMTANGRTPEDVYAATVAQDYVDFIRVKPWYEFNFASRLKSLWTNTNLWGDNILRRWERRYALTTEYGVKAVYGWLIGLATHSIYEPPREVTSVALDHWPACETPVDGVDLLLPANGGPTLVSLPRYQDFMAPMVSLARCGAQFQEIAGNRSVIVFSIVQPIGATSLPAAKALLLQPILTRPGRERVVYEIPVAALADALRTIGGGAPSVELEHIFDY